MPNVYVYGTYMYIILNPPKGTRNIQAIKAKIITYCHYILDEALFIYIIQVVVYEQKNDTHTGLMYIVKKKDR